MTEYDRRLEENRKAFKEFTDNTRNPWRPLKQIYSELDFRGFRQRKPLITLHKRIKNLFALYAEEAGLKNDYDRLMMEGDYAQKPADYFEAMTAEIRKMRGLPEDAEISMSPDSEEWKKASAKVLRKWENSVKRNIDRKGATVVLVNFAGKKVETYTQIKKAMPEIKACQRLARKPYVGSFTSGSEENAARLDENLQTINNYVNMFPNHVTKLINESDLKYEFPLVD